MFKKIVISGCTVFLLCLSINNISALSDDDFLDMVQKNSFNFFWDETFSSVGLISDTACYKAGEGNKNMLSSVACVGFGLTVICAAHSRGWISYNQAYDRVLTTLNTFKNNVEGKKGFYYHMVKKLNGERDGTSEVSSIDTALFLAGALFAGKYFQGTEIEAIADELYKRADWYWMCGPSGYYISMGWKPENEGAYTISYDGGYLCNSYWDSYDEGVLLNILAIGSPTYKPRDYPDCWENMKYDTKSYSPYNDIRICDGWYNPLFLHQYAQLWVDLRKREDNLFNCYDNSIKATLANKAYCINEWSSCCSENAWGFTVCEGPHGYTEYGAEPWVILQPNNDGTIALTASGGSVMFTPDASINTLRYIYDTYKNTTWNNDPEAKIWNKYGFADSFNICSNWCSINVIGLDQGAIFLSIENYRTALIWDIFMQIPYINNALNIIGFNNTADITRPSAITDLQIKKKKLIWTAPGDDGYAGLASSYEIRYLDREIISYADWFEAGTLFYTLAPSIPGAQETADLTSLLSGTYYFAIRTVDDEGNKSPLSNCTDALNLDISKNRLFQNNPNPFNLNKYQYTTIKYSIKENVNVSLKLCTITGGLIKEWHQGFQTPNTYYIEWFGKNKNSSLVSPGVYILVLLVNNNKADGIKIVVIK